MTPNPAPCLHFAKTTAADASESFVPMSPHAFTRPFQSEGVMPRGPPPNALNAANSASRWPICRCISATDSPARTSMPGGAYFVSGRAAARSRADAKKGANVTRASAPPFAAVSAMALVTAVCDTSSGMRRSSPTSANAWSASTGVNTSPVWYSSAYLLKMWSRFASVSASGGGAGPLACCAASSADAAATRSFLPSAAPVILKSSLTFDCGRHCDTRDTTCPNVALCSTATAASASKNEPSSQRTRAARKSFCLATVRRVNIRSTTVVVTAPPMSPQSTIIFM
mmetsp:Transcript_11541/g.41564  ORF Transcript_11541/g.41564 Transcript_11541/m.41564 type:complete len:284 (+) Transcript_11541:971-1822(+)